MLECDWVAEENPDTNNFHTARARTFRRSFTNCSEGCEFCDFIQSGTQLEHLLVMLSGFSAMGRQSLDELAEPQPWKYKAAMYESVNITFKQDTKNVIDPF